MARGGQQYFGEWRNGRGRKGRTENREWPRHRQRQSSDRSLSDDSAKPRCEIQRGDAEGGRRTSGVGGSGKETRTGGECETDGHRHIQRQRQRGEAELRLGA